MRCWVFLAVVAATLLAVRARDPVCLAYREDAQAQFSFPTEDKTNKILSWFAEDCRIDEYPPAGPTYKGTIPEYVINLDLPPSERWIQVARDKKNELKTVIKVIRDIVLSFIHNEKFIASMESKIGWLCSTLPYPFNEEIKGIASAIDATLGDVVVFNIFYEIFTVCTSIIAEDKAGKLYHARNLDFGLFLGWDIQNNSWYTTQKLKPLMVSLDFQKNNKTVFKSANFAGYVGIVTGVKQGLFTLTMNERFSLDGGYIGIFEWLIGKRDGWWMSFLTRAVLENSTSYEDAKDKLANTKLLAPAYFILGGNKSDEGCVITRSRSAALNIKNLDAKNGSWFVIETNYDPWKAPLIIDDRRHPAMNCLNQTGQEKIALPDLYNVLSTKPILNKVTLKAPVSSFLSPGGKARPQKSSLDDLNQGFSTSVDSLNHVARSF